MIYLEIPISLHVGSVPKIVKTRLGVGGRGADLREGQNFPLFIAKGREVPRSRRNFPSHAARGIAKSPPCSLPAGRAASKC